MDIRLLVILRHIANDENKIDSAMKDNMTVWHWSTGSS